jgi:PadR family transcriptional regulator PadR
VGENKTEMLHGTLDLLVLQVLSDGPLHGYAIAKRLRSLSNDVVSVDQGSLYPALYRMEKRGWLRSSWGVTDANRRAKTYRLTRAGRRQLDAETAGWEKFAAAVHNVIRSSGGDA